MGSPARELHSLVQELSVSVKDIREEDDGDIYNIGAEDIAQRQVIKPPASPR